MLIEGLWHALKVVSAGLYWLLFICLIWAGFALMGTSPQWGWGNLAFVLALFAAKGYAGRWLKGGASYVAGCGVIAVYLIFAAIATGWQNV
jgi:hypothetical protein